MALLRSTPLTEDQIIEVVREIAKDHGSPATTDHPIDRDEIAEFIKDMTHYDAGPENVVRVAARLAAVGWPLAGIDVSEVIPGDEDGEAAEEVAARSRASSSTSRSYDATPDASSDSADSAAIRSAASPSTSPGMTSLTSMPASGHPTAANLAATRTTFSGPAT